MQPKHEITVIPPAKDTKESQFINMSNISKTEEPEDADSSSESEVYLNDQLY